MTTIEGEGGVLVTEQELVKWGVTCLMSAGAGEKESETLVGVII